MREGKKPLGMKHRIREERKKEERIAVIITVAILIAIIFISGFLINSMLNQPSSSQPVSSTVEPKAAIVDHLSLTLPNQTFTQTATNTLKQAGYTVDYYPGEKVTVEFYKNLPTHNYGIIILRIHSTKDGYFFTSQPYSSSEYVFEQLGDQVGKTSCDGNPPFCFGIAPTFVKYSMKGKFEKSTIIMMGCNGLTNYDMAQAFIRKGAKVYIGWSDFVSASHTDQATAHLLHHLLTEKQTLKDSIRETYEEVGRDPAFETILLYYPLEAGGYAIQNIVGTQVILSAIGKINHKGYQKQTL